MKCKEKFCIWLIDELLRKDLTLQEIKKKWEKSGSNTEEEDLTSRSFSRYRSYAQDLFDVDIDCRKNATGEYYYMLKNKEDVQNGYGKSWLISSYRVAGLQDIKNYRDLVYLEDVPTGSEYLYELIDAIKSSEVLRLRYHSYYVNEFEALFIPRFVRLFKQRWYVVGENFESGEVRTYALERIKSIESTKEKAEGRKLNKELNDPKAYFYNYYGIVRTDKPVTIRFRAFDKQAKYIESVSLHHSQKMISDNSEYSDFEIYAAPTYDLIQEFLSHRENLCVLSPSSLREEMKECILKMAERYKD
ncbi:MAG: WYL domain-containing protein [Bacteroidales bacterium]